VKWHVIVYTAESSIYNPPPRTDDPARSLATHPPLQFQKSDQLINSTSIIHFSIPQVQATAFIRLKEGWRA
jgi:hypothetical protein